MDGCCNKENGVRDIKGRRIRVAGAMLGQTIRQQSVITVCKTSMPCEPSKCCALEDHPTVIAYVYNLWGVFAWNLGDLKDKVFVLNVF